jgi:hypothetical protein
MQTRIELTHDVIMYILSLLPLSEISKLRLVNKQLKLLIDTASPRNITIGNRVSVYQPVSTNTVSTPEFTHSFMQQDLRF